MNSQTADEKDIAKPLPEIKQLIGIFTCFLCAKPSCIATEGCSCIHLKTIGLVNASTVGYQS